jgi:uncharacterized membrane protein YhaH (DUF805 family)
LFCSVGSLATIILDIAILGYDNVSPFTDIFNLVLLLPSIAVGARRLHDIDRTAWWLLLWLTGVGFILLVVWFCFRGTPGPNRFGPDPFSTSR